MTDRAVRNVQRTLNDVKTGTSGVAGDSAVGDVQELTRRRRRILSFNSAERVTADSAVADVGSDVAGAGDGYAVALVFIEGAAGNMQGAGALINAAAFRVKNRTCVTCEAAVSYPHNRSKDPYIESAASIGAVTVENAVVD